MKFHRDNFKLKSFNMKRSKTWNKWLNEINDTFQVLWRVSSHVKPKLLKGTFHKLRTQLSKWYMIYLVLADTFISHHSRFLHKWCTNCCRNEINILFFYYRITFLKKQNIASTKYGKSRHRNLLVTIGYYDFLCLLLFMHFR